MIPPAILHTIIENGITHSLPDQHNRVLMILAFEENDSAKVYTLNTIAKSRSSIYKKKGGTGLKYIQSRLTENYGTLWTLESQATATGWETKIILLK